MIPTFGYWELRCVGQPIRFLLAYLNIKHNLKHYMDFDEWFVQDKFSLDLDFPNLPYLIDGDIKITESAAISVYLIKKSNRYDLLGLNADGSFNIADIKVQQLLGFFRDVQRELKIGLCSNPDFLNIKETFLTEKLQPMLDRIVKYLGEKEYLIGSLTYADFICYEILNYYKYIYPQTLTPTVQAYMLRFENLHGIREYLVNPDINLKQFLPPQFCAWSGPQ